MTSTDTDNDFKVHKDFGSDANTDFGTKEKPKLIVPGEYEINENGIFHLVEMKDEQRRPTKNYVKIPISHTPFYITHIIENSDTHEVFFRLVFKNIENIFPMSELLSRKVCQNLSRYGIITSDSDNTHMMAFIKGIIALNPIPRIETFSSMGWKDDGSFVLGKKKITTEGMFECDFCYEGNEPRGIYSSGSMDGWVQSVKGMMKHHSQRFKVYLGVKALIIKIIGAQNHSVNDSGSTGRGKTLTCMVTTSMFGDPDVMVFAGGGTEYSIEKTADQMCDLPIHIDDTHKIDYDVLCETIYMIGNGVGKVRGKRNASGIEKTSRFNTIALMTGEKTIIRDNSGDGLDMRLIEIDGGLNCPDIEAVRSFNDGVRVITGGRNYGVFGEKLIQWIVNNKEKIKELHNESVSELRGMVSGVDVMNSNIIAVQDRLSGMFSSILTAGKIFEIVYKSVGGEEKNPLEVIKVEYQKALDDRASDSYILRGARYIQSWISSHKSYFLSDGLRWTDSSGYEKQYVVVGDIREKKNEIAIIPTELKKASCDLFDIEGIFRELKKEGILITSQGRNTRSSRIEGKSVHTYVLATEKFNAFCGSGDDEK